jgi:hypothetical protein
VRILEIPRVEIGNSGIGNSGIAMCAATSELRCDVEAADRKQKANQSERRIPPTRQESRDGSRSFNRHSRSSLTPENPYAPKKGWEAVPSYLKSLQ